MRQFPMKIGKGIAIGAVVGLALLLATWATQSAPPPQIVWETNAHGSFLRGIAFTKDGRWLGTGGNNDQLRIWSLETRSEVWSVDTTEKVTSLAFAPDGARVVGGGDDGATQLWDIASGRRLWGETDDNSGIMYTLSFSPGGQQLAMGSTYGGIIANPATGEGDGRSLDRAKTVFTVFSPDGAKLARAVHISPEGYEPLMGYARIVDASNYTALYTLTGHSNHVYSVDFSPDGQVLLTTSLDGTARLWNVSDGTVVRVIEGGGGVFGKFSADGKTFFTCAGFGSVDFLYDTGTLKFWRTSDGALLGSFDNLGAGPIAVSPAGKYFAYGKAGGELVVAYVPLWIESIKRANGEITLRWQDGSGKYQVQARENLSTGDWQNLGGVTTNTTFTHTCLSPLFYRVQSLPNPP